MAVQLTVPVSTEVIEGNPDCKIYGVYEGGRVVIVVDTRHQHHHQRLGVGTKTALHWGEEHEYEVQELSGLAWPIRYRVLSRDGYYMWPSPRTMPACSCSRPWRASSRQRRCRPPLPKPQAGPPLERETRGSPQLGHPNVRYDHQGRCSSPSRAEVEQAP